MQNAYQTAQTLPDADIHPLEYINYECKCSNLPCNVYRCLDLFNEKDLLEFAADITAKKQSNMRNFM